MTCIALLGCGTIGTRVAQLLLQSNRLAAGLAPRCAPNAPPPIHSKTPRSPHSQPPRRAAPSGGQARPLNGIQIAAILVRDPSRPRPGIRPDLLTADPADILNDPSIDLAIEVVGGVEPVGTLIRGLLARGVDVVTANKTLLAHRFQELHETAAASGARLAFEAAVGGAMPVIRAIRGLSFDRVISFRGIISGSCNYILTRVQRDGWSITRAIESARELGLVEPDPSADLSGRDAAEKLAVISHMLGRPLHPSHIDLTGLDTLQTQDIDRAWRDDKIIRFVAQLDDSGARIAPVALNRRDPLADVDDQENAAVIETELSGRIVLRGPGAGPDPTAATILGDALELLALRSTSLAASRAPSNHHDALISPRTRSSSALVSRIP